MGRFNPASAPVPVAGLKEEQRMSNEERLDCVKSICELVEDKSFPSRRVITDYVVLLIQSYDYQFGKEVEKFINDYYEKATSPRLTGFRIFVK